MKQVTCTGDEADQPSGGRLASKLVELSYVGSRRRYDSVWLLSVNQVALQRILRSAPRDPPRAGAGWSVRAPSRAGAVARAMKREEPAEPTVPEQARTRRCVALLQRPRQHLVRGTATLCRSLAGRG
jgi:hypothetical protein